jgi:FHA domain
MKEGGPAADSASTNTVVLSAASHALPVAPSSAAAVVDGTATTVSNSKAQLPVQSSTDLANSVVDLQTPPAVTVGGDIAQPALCLLDGIECDESANRTTLPIARLPVVLGRSHDSDDGTYFVGMGRSKAFSRQHMRIDYRIPIGNNLTVCAFAQNDLENEVFELKKDDKDTLESAEIWNFESPRLPENGFYTVTCLGKNRIIVNQRRLEQGETVLLESGFAIRVGNLALYFLEPTEPSTNFMEIEGPPVKKRKWGGVSSAKPTVASAKRPMILEIEELPTKKLLRRMTAAVDKDVWDRKHQLIGSTISYRAILDCARAMRKAGKTEVSRTEVMDWISDTDRYGEWVDQMLTKMEPKSYQSSITKALIKANFNRTSSTGRYIKWTLPPNVEVEDDFDDFGDSSDGDDDDDDDNEGGTTKDESVGDEEASDDQNMDEEDAEDEEDDA